MTNLFNYVEKYGDKTFKEKKFNDIDNIVFSTLSYLNFTSTSINKSKYTLELIGKEYINKNKYRKIKKIGTAQKTAYKLLNLMIKKERYKNIILSDYVYNTNKNMQFSAITFNISKRLKYICFEGTDEKIGGWKEDCEMSCMFPVPSQVEAVEYVNKHVNILGPKVIIGGHSKGGNLALVSSMFIDSYKRFKVKKIYNNDGPGLRNTEFNTDIYRKIKSKYIHIIPNSSIIGVLLNNENNKVVKSNKKNFLCHDMTTWEIKNDEFIPSTLSLKSKKIEQNILSWVNINDDNKINMIIKDIFQIMEDYNIEDTLKLKKFKNIIRVTRRLKHMNKESKRLLLELVKQ